MLAEILNKTQRKMGTFAIIFIIICFLAGMLSRTRTTIYQDNDNAHLFKEPTIIQNSEVTKESLFAEIDHSYEHQDYRNTKLAVQKYLYYYQPTIQVLIIYVFSLLELNEVEEAEKYANKTLYEFDYDKYGYYLLGSVEYYKGNFSRAKSYFKDALDYGLMKSWITNSIPDQRFLNELFNDKEKEKDYDDLPF